MSECNQSSGDGGLRGNGQWSPWSTIAFLTAIGCSSHLVTKYGSTLYIGIDEVLAHYACTFENSDLHFNFQ